MITITCKRCGNKKEHFLSQITEYCSPKCYHADRYKGNDYKKLGFKREDRLLIEKVLGYKPNPKIKIHHLNGKNGEFVICEDQKYHMLLHLRQRAYTATGDKRKRKCNFCKQWDDLNNLYIYNNKTVRHRNCYNNYQNNLKKEV